MSDSIQDEMYEIGFEEAPIGMAFLSPDHTWLKINREFCDLLGFTQEELWHVKCEEVLHPDEVDRVMAFRDRLLSGGLQTGKLETRYIRKDRTSIYVEIRSSMMKDEHGKPDYFVDIVEDITDIRRARRAARETAENYKLLVEKATDHGIIRMDNDGNIISWNAGAESIFGYTENEILGKSVAIFFTSEDSKVGMAERELETALLAGRAEDDRWHVRKDGSRFWASGVVTSVKDEIGRPNGYVKIMRDLTDRKLSQERSLYLAQHDSLTGLPNRGKFHDDLAATINEARLSKTKIGVLFIDLDRFKNINDSLGHHSGDMLLICVSQRLIDCIRKTDIVARLGGDEFGVICKGVQSQCEMEQLATKLVYELSQPFRLKEHQVTIGASIGVTLYPKDTDDADQILKYADMAMYEAKSRGRSTYQLYTSNLDAEAKRRNSIEDELRHALERDELHLHYQPQISLTSNRTCAVEALLRWENRNIPPMATEEFIALADETGLIVPIGEWVLLTACKQMRVWREAGQTPLRMAVNVSSRQLQDLSFPSMVDRVLEASGIDPHDLELEITEGLLMENSQRNTSVLRELKARGVNISVDDFGTGFSSLSYLKHFPIDTLKIDQLFVKCLPHDQHDAAIASAIIGMAHSLNLTVVAEGIETREQLEFLREMGCNYGQGFLFSEAVSSAALSRFFLDQPVGA